VPEEDRVRRACAYLRMLLFRPGDYRSRWERYSQSGGGPIDPQAVAAVLDERRLRRSGVPAERRVLTRPAEELVRVARHALDGSVLRPTDLEEFIVAFGLSVRHAHRLRELRRGSPSVLAIDGTSCPPGDAYRPLGPPHFDTLSFHELHTVGPDGRPAEHETIQVIRSTVPWLESVPYRFDTDELVVHMVRGGQVGPRVYRVNETVYGVDILLAQPLALGETALLQQHTTFAYRTQPPPELRRAVLREVQELTMWVRFHPERVPARVWSARWDRIDQARIIERAPVELDSELSVHARFGRVEQSVVGLYWEWD